MTFSKTSLLSGLAVAGGLMASAQAAVTLPSNHVQLTSDAVFDTSFEPKINVKTGLLADPGVLPTLSAWGEVVNIADASDSEDMGSVSGELTWHFTGTLEADDIQMVKSGNSVRYIITSKIKDAEVSFYDDETPDFNVLSLVGKSASNAGLASAVDGELYMRAVPADEDLRGVIDITFFRVSATADYTTFKINQQYINNETSFAVTEGSILTQYGDVIVEGLNAGQIGPFPSSGGQSFATETLGNATVNANVDKLIRANSSAVLTTHNVIPEPASASLLALGGAALLARRRKVA